MYNRFPRLENTHTTLLLLATLLSILLLSGCSTYGVVQNESQKTISTANRSSIQSHLRLNAGRANDISILLTFSGGGTRSAALSYGVLKALHDTRIAINGRSVRLLDEVDIISSVSGGSFTAAYYGLYGEGIFNTFKEVFLTRNVEQELVGNLYNPLRWFNSKGRTDHAVTYYDEIMFHGATFADIQRKNQPLIVINASDLGEGVRFSFLQEYFNLLCSELSSFPISRAVTASSAVPVLFNPIVLRNHTGCPAKESAWLPTAQARLVENSEMSLVTQGLKTYLNKDKRKYIHLVDGGITDNLGLRAIYEIIEIAGGMKAFQTKFKLQTPHHIALIVVDASTNIEPLMDKSNEEPGIEETINAMTDAQMHRYNAATLRLLEQSQIQWSQELSTTETTVEPYFIQLGFKNLDYQKQKFFNQIPTSLSLNSEQVDKLIEVGKELLQNNPSFQRLLSNLSQ